MGERIQKRMTVEEFFEWQQSQDRNYELVDGLPVMSVKAMTGATVRHDRITVNAIVGLGNQLRGKPCQLRTWDQSLLTFRGTRRPDVSVECGKPDDRSMATDEPRVVIEILSPSTMRFDRFEKLAEYQQHPAIKVILLVDTEAPQVTVWRRTESNWLPEAVSGLEAIVRLPEIDANLLLAELYEGLDFQAQ